MSAKAVLAITCRMKSGTASCTLTHIRVLISWPMSTLRAESDRPKSSAKSEIERSQRTVSVTFSPPSALAFQ
jgi:hypothetical protein